MTVKEAESGVHISRGKVLAQVTIPQIPPLKKKSHQFYKFLESRERGSVFFVWPDQQVILEREAPEEEGQRVRGKEDRAEGSRGPAHACLGPAGSLGSAAADALLPGQKGTGSAAGSAVLHKGTQDDSRASQAEHTVALVLMSRVF